MPNEYTLNIQKFEDYFTQYLKGIKETDWLTKREAYKFRFANWLHSRVDFSKHSNSEILRVCRESQEIKFSETNETGINFIKSNLRYRDEFIEELDIQILRDLHKLEVTDEILKRTDLNLPKFGIWLATLIPEKYWVYASSELIPGIADLFDLKKYPKQGIKFFLLVQELFSIVGKKLEERKEEYEPYFLKVLEKNQFEPVDKVWLVQDFFLFIARRILKKEINYWIFQGNPDVYDVVRSIKDNMINTWWVKSHKEKIKVGDKVILWVTGNNSGCYALCEVTSGVYEDFDDNDQDKYYKEGYLESRARVKSSRVRIKVTHDFTQNPILHEQIRSNKKVFKEFKAGNQGTTFSATKEQYEEILKMAKGDDKKKYWIYAPGRNASEWEDFYKKGIMAIGWDKLGDLNNYKSRKQIQKELKKEYESDHEPLNNSLACYEFANTIKKGDIIISKKGKTDYLGYGIVVSDYYFDDSTKDFKSQRKVKWIKKGNWKESGGPIVLKTLTDITKYPDYVEKLKNLIGIEIKGEKMDPKSIPLNLILYGPPGTGKTYKTILRAAQIIENRIIDNYNEALEIFNKNLENQIEFITFHQNYSYEDFIQGIRPDVENSTELSFERQDGVFKKISDRALKNLKDSAIPEEAKKDFDEVFNEFISPLNENEVEKLEIQMKNSSYFITEISRKSIHFEKRSGSSLHSLSIETLKKMYEKDKNDIIIGGLQPYYNPLLDELLKRGKGKAPATDRKNYVIIIDEINRANISRVFGELITLIEPDKRSHGDIPLKCTLPSGEEFIVPSNLYIIGTMNTADKSIALLDIALRRRFIFEPMFPEYDIEGQEIYDVEVLKKINEKIIEKKGHDFQIGHAYFMNDNRDMIQRMNHKVIPLLLEYFMNDKNEVKEILEYAGLEVDLNVWPLQIIE